MPVSECIKVTGKKPIGTRWTDINKQDEIDPLYRSRLVGQEFNNSQDATLYVATPPLEAIRTILGLAATKMQNRKDDLQATLMLHVIHIVIW